MSSGSDHFVNSVTAVLVREFTQWATLATQVGIVECLFTLTCTASFILSDVRSCGGPAPHWPPTAVGCVKPTGE